MKEVELHHAWVWDCDECGRENVAHGIAADASTFTDEDREAASEVLGVDADEILIEQELVMQPEEVTCMHCGATFRVVEKE